MLQGIEFSEGLAKSSSVFERITCKSDVQYWGSYCRWQQYWSLRDYAGRPTLGCIKRERRTRRYADADVDEPNRNNVWSINNRALATWPAAFYSVLIHATMILTSL